MGEWEKMWLDVAVETFDRIELPGMKTVRRFVGFGVWTAAETFGVGLGKHAPYVFGWMIGCKPVRVEDTVMEEDGTITEDAEPHMPLLNVGGCRFFQRTTRTFFCEEDTAHGTHNPAYQCIECNTIMCKECTETHALTCEGN